MKKLFLIFFSVISIICFSQNSQDQSFQSFTRLNLGLHGLEVTNELPISKRLIWENSLGIGMGSFVNNNVNYRLIFDVLVPFLTSELKLMYNKNKRLEKGRSRLNNSGNYVGLQAKYSFGSSKTFELNQTLLTEIHWGIQRPLGKRFIFDLHLGLGYLLDFDSEEGLASPTFGLRFGYLMF